MNELLTASSSDLAAVVGPLRRDGARAVEAFALGAWSAVVEPGDAVGGLARRVLGAAVALRVVLESVDRRVSEGDPSLLGQALRQAGVDPEEISDRRIARALSRWEPRTDDVRIRSSFRAATAIGLRLVVPGDDEWPVVLDDLGDHAPAALWLRGSADLPTVASTIAVVGCRASTAYGEQVAADLSSALCDRGFTIVSGGAYGIDGMAHRAALVSEGPTVAVMAGGVDRFYPSGHDTLLRSVVEKGLLVSESPCGSTPSKWRFLHQKISVYGRGSPSEGRTTGMSEVRAAIYLRISDDRNDDRAAVTRQLSEAQELAKKKNWKVTEVYEDNDVGAFARKTRRPEYERMSSDYKSGRIDAILCADLDRLTRQPRQLEDWIEEAEDNGLIIVTLNGEADLSTDSGRMLARVKVAVGRAEVERKSARQKSKNRQLVSQGKPVPGRRRYGYEPGNMRPRPTEAVVVSRAFETIAAGGTVYGLAKTLNAEGVPVPKRGDGAGPDRKWTPRRLREMCNNPSYEGLVRHTVLGVETLTPSKYVTPLVEPELAQAVRQVLADPSRRTSPSNQVRHLLSGIASCGICGASMLYMRDYRCKTSAAHPSIRKSILEPLVRAEVLAALLCGPSAVLPRPVSGTTLQSLDLALQILHARREELLALIRESLSTLEAERPHLAKIKADEAALKRKRDDLAQSSIAAKVLLSAREGLYDGGKVSLAAAASQRRLLGERLDALPLEQQRELIRLLLTISVQKGRGAERVDVQHQVVTSLNEKGVDAL